MLFSVSLKVILDRKLIAMVHFQGGEGGYQEGGTELGQGYGEMVSQTGVTRFQSSMCKKYS